MTGGCLDAGDGVLQVIERATTAGTGDVFRLGELDACGLKDGIRKTCKLLALGSWLLANS